MTEAELRSPITGDFQKLKIYQTHIIIAEHYIHSNKKRDELSSLGVARSNIIVMTPDNINLSKSRLKSMSINSANVHVVGNPNMSVEFWQLLKVRTSLFKQKKDNKMSKDKELKKDIEDTKRALNHAISRAEEAGLAVQVNVLELNNINSEHPTPLINCKVLRPL